MFDGRSEEKIIAWRNFRKTLTAWPDSIATVAKQWAKAPQVNHYLSYDDPESWPDAWTLVSEGIYCEISVALGMAYTLYYSDYEGKDSVEIRSYVDKQNHQILNLVILEEGSHILNYDVGLVVSEKNLTLPSPRCIIKIQDLVKRKLINVCY